MRLSIIVCTRNRSHAIVECLESVRNAIDAASPVEAEIVVVDNNSTDDTSAVINNWAKTCNLKVRTVVEIKPGLAAARNCGIRASSGELLAFTDDDCKMTPSYITEALNYDATDEQDTLRGGSVLLGDQRDLPITIKTESQSAIYSHPMHPAGFILGANMLMRRSLVDRIGLFDERFGSGTRFPGEDCDYIIRANIAQIPIHYVPNMAVLHFHGRRDPADIKRLFAGYMRANGALYIKHLRTMPNLFKHFWWDAKWWAKEIITGERSLAEDELERKDITLNNIVGMVEFSLREIGRIVTLQSIREGKRK